MPVAQVLEGKVPVKIWTRDIDRASMRQLQNIASLPFVFHHVAAMPDAHLGIGATVGSVVATRGAIIPAAVGVDIGCGMAALKLPFKAAGAEGRLKEIRRAIESAVPVGFESHREPVAQARAWEGWSRFEGVHRKVFYLRNKAMAQMGTLGGGNHFIELLADEGEGLWLMLHSGSRNLGKSLADVHIQEAKGRLKGALRSLPDQNLAYLSEGSSEFDAYLHDLHFAQDYALQNRKTILFLILRELSLALSGGNPIAPEMEINCHHNYAVEETHFGSRVWVTRKGAIRAGKGELGIIPGSMGTKSYIVRGQGNPESFESSSHGAGRRLSRHEAKRRFGVADLKKQTQGVECRKDAGVLDEIPSAYKPIDEVMGNSSDLVEIIHELKPMLSVKG